LAIGGLLFDVGPSTVPFLQEVNTTAVISRAAIDLVVVKVIDPNDGCAGCWDY
jgi:hypothetical protein